MLTILRWDKIGKRPRDLILHIDETGPKVPRKRCTHSRYVVRVEMYFRAYSVVKLKNLNFVQLSILDRISGTNEIIPLPEHL
jgi:hypothetical protein